MTGDSEEQSSSGSRAERSEAPQAAGPNGPATQPDDIEVREIAALLEDEYAHAILIYTSTREMSAPELSDACEASVSTIYRRIECLQEHDLLAEQLNLDQDGHHYKTYTARLERIEIELVDNAFEIEVIYRPEDATDRFTDLFEGLR